VICNYLQLEWRLNKTLNAFLDKVTIGEIGNKCNLKKKVNFDYEQWRKYVGLLTVDEL